MKKILVLLISIYAINAQGSSQRLKYTKFNIAYTLYKEVASDGHPGIKYVASVIYNRRKIKHTTYNNIVKAKWQFSCWNKIKGPRILLKNKIDKEYWHYCNNIADQMINGTFKPVCNSTHYYNPKLCNPKWRQNLKYKFRYKNHIFGKTYF